MSNDTPNPDVIPSDDTLEVLADFANPNDDLTPTMIRPSEPPDACPKCKLVSLVRVADIIPLPASVKELRSNNYCFAPNSGEIVWCSNHLSILAGPLCLFVGEDRRELRRSPPPGIERRAILPPPFPPRNPTTPRRDEGGDE